MRRLRGVIGIVPVFFLAGVEGTRGESPSPAGRNAEVLAGLIDRHVQDRLDSENLPVSPRADDAEFLRRLYLDLTGRIPTGEEATAFLDSTDPDKRAQLLGALLAGPASARHFASLWHDRFLAQGITQGYQSKTGPLADWLAEQFQRNRGWDEVVRELLTAQGNPDENPPALYTRLHFENHQARPDQMASAATRLFLGVQLQCAECHNHPYAAWTQEDFWGLAAFFSLTRNASGKNTRNFNITEDPSLVVTIPGEGKGGGKKPGPAPPAPASTEERIGKPRPANDEGGSPLPNPLSGAKGSNPPLLTVGHEGADKPPKPIAGRKESVAPAPVAPPGSILIPSRGGNKGAGRVIQARFLDGSDPELGDRGPYRPQFAAWATSAQNPFFAKAAVNRLWGHFFGRGLVHPVDDLHEGNPPSHPRLLELLANELVASGFDLQYLIRALCLSHTYQRSSRPVPGNEADGRCLSHMTVKVLAPAALYHSLTRALGTPALADEGFDAAAKVHSLVKGREFAATPFEKFVKFFGSESDTDDPTAYVQGIPQALSLMNSPQFQRNVPVVGRLVRAGAGPQQGIEMLYLGTLSRRPTEAEAGLMADYLGKQPDAQAGFAGILWILINSTEFLVNH